MQFKDFWKTLRTEPSSIEIIQDENSHIVCWQEGSVAYSEAFETSLQAEEKASQLRGNPITFTNLHKSQDALSKTEVAELQRVIKKLVGQKKPAQSIIKYLQNWNSKLGEYYKAKRAFETENKNLQSEEIIHSADNLGIEKFKCLLSPNACETCRSKTQNGNKVFDQNELTKDGYGHRPPFHPHCYCALIPYAD